MPFPLFREDLKLHLQEGDGAPGWLDRDFGPAWRPGGPAQAGSNLADAASPAALAVRPGDGADTVTGTAGADVLSGAGGKDVISGGAGNDVLYGFGPADRDPGSGLIEAERVAQGLSKPLFAASPPGDPDRLFIVEQHTGRIVILDTVSGQLEPTPFLDLPEREIRTGGEQGLLGLAFHPDYEANGKFYVFLTNIEGTIEVREYTRSADPDVANASYKLVMSIPHPDFANHNGGWMGFGPDGYLYIAVGDGGGVGDPDNSAQDLNSLLGKLLRIDVDGDDFPTDAGRNYAIPDDNPFVGQAGADEVWAYGLRNPWRCSFDPVTGDLYIADVGQGAREEINFVPAGSPGGLNFGWHVREGDLPYDTDTPGNPAPGDPSLVDPVLVYPHVNGADGGRSITGGYAYYGPGGAQGQYFFADYVNNNIWTISVDETGEVVDFTNRNGQIVTDQGVINQVNSFAVDGQGRLYVIGLDGEIFRLTPSAAAADGADQISGGEGDDRIYGGAGADALNGDSGADLILGGIQNDALNGGDGDDTLEGGAGADALNGGTGRDIAGYGQAAAGVALNRATGVHTGDAAGDTFTSVEEFRLSAFADSFLGASAADLVRGQGGADLLDGADGSDTLYGGDGDDTLRGGLAADLLYGDSGADSLFGGDGADRAYGALGGDLIEGEAGADRLYGQDGDDILRGGADADQLDGGAGADQFDGGDGYDIVLYGTAAAAVGLNLASGAHTGDAAGDSFAATEEFRLSSFDDSFVGAAGGDTVRGLAGNDLLDGGDGADLLYGGVGADQLRGDAGNDRAYGEAGADQLDGGAGDDLLYGGADGDGLTGGDGRDRLVGELGDDSYAGGAGADQFWMNRAGFGADVVLDFEDGLDRIRVSGVAGVDGLEDLDVGSNGSGWAVITFPDGSTVTLQGVAATAVDASDFYWG